MIKIDKLKVEYPPQEFSLDPISMNIEKGEIISLVGGNQEVARLPLAKQL